MRIEYEISLSRCQGAEQLTRENLMKLPPTDNVSEVVHTSRPGFQIVHAANMSATRHALGENPKAQTFF